MLMETQEIVSSSGLKEFCEKIFMKLGVDAESAKITADNLVSADMRGVKSHGVARLKRYVDGIKSGIMKINTKERILRESPCTCAIDAMAGLGQPVSYRAMKRAMEMAGKTGVGLVTVCNSNHYGIAGYYAMMALEKNMIGISMTNSAPLVVPTFGKSAIMGTNPISVAFPAGSERPYVLDMATSTVPRGKLEVYERMERPMPVGWATDEKGIDCTGAGHVLNNINNRLGGGLLPLGGAGEELSGHKGYGLALMVELFSGVLSGSSFLDDTYPKDENGKALPPDIGHFFGAVNIENFRNMEDFKRDMDRIIRRLKASEKASGQDRIFIHGEKEFEMAEKYEKEGIPVHSKVMAVLRNMAEELGIEYDL